MTKASVKPGDEVTAPRTNGTIIDIRPTVSGHFVFGVEDPDGEVTYHTAKALTRA